MSVAVKADVRAESAAQAKDRQDLTYGLDQNPYTQAPHLSPRRLRGRPSTSSPSCSPACARAAAACTPAGRRPLAHRGRAAARSHAWRHGDQRRHGAGQGCRQEAARSGRDNRRAAARRRPRRQGRRRRAPASSISRCKPQVWGEELRVRAGGRARDYGRSDIGQGRKGQCRIRLGQSDRADACRARPRRGVWRRARQSAGVCRLRGDARILHQRCRRPGRRARPLGLSALPRGARRGHRRHSGGALPRRLSARRWAANSPPNTASS